VHSVENGQPLQFWCQSTAHSVENGQVWESELYVMWAVRCCHFILSHWSRGGQALQPKGRIKGVKCCEGLGEMWSQCFEAFLAYFPYFQNINGCLWYCLVIYVYTHKFFFFCAVPIVSKESKRLFLPRTYCFLSGNVPYAQWMPFLATSRRQMVILAVVDTRLNFHFKKCR
jgi:hypothetical protein